jgi:sugar transferase (PEP-CTERM/EpsH1 system associated)
VNGLGILWVKTELLHPVDKGGRIRTYQMLKALAAKHRVTYLTLDDGGAAPDAIERAREYAERVVTVPFSPPPKGGSRFYVALARNIASPLPYAIARYRSPELRARIAELAPTVDVVVCDFLAPSLNVPDGLNVPTVLFQHNVEAALWERHAAVPQNTVRRAYMREQARRMRAFEAAECRRFGRVVAVSEADADTMRRDYGPQSVRAVPTGVDLEYFRPIEARARTSSEIVFVGSMDWMPNEEGIRWFADEVFPTILAKAPEAVLTIVGRLPTPAVLELARRNPSIRVTGTVPDVRPYMERAALSIVPLRIGGGTRLKIFEAMATRLPVVSTTIGAEGLPVADGRHLLIRDSDAEFADAVIGLLQAPARAQVLADNALSYVREHCGWAAVADQFVEACGFPLSKNDTRPRMVS